VFFWQVNKFNGQFGDDPNQNNDITEEEVLSAIAYLNIEFNKFNLFFKYRGLDQFNSPEIVYLQEKDEFGFCQDLLDGQGNPIIDINGFNTIDNFCQLDQLRDFALANEFMPDNYINVYIPYGTIGFAAAAGVSNPRIIVKREDFTSLKLIHEMGHALYLSHPHRGHRDSDDPLNTEYTLCKHVTREPLLPDGSINEEYNADTAGDIIIDTNASPNFRLENYYELLEQGYSEEYAEENYELLKYIDEIDCSYTGTGKDCLGDNYQLSNSDTQNIMAYTRNQCRESFTIGQAIRMHEIVELWPENYELKLAELSDLFEPYSGEYYLAGPAPDPHNLPLFQPGFEYRFVDCEGNYSVPAEYGTIFPYDKNTVLLLIHNNEIDYTNITHPNHSAIWIKHDYGNFLDKPEKCYDNWNRNPKDGSVTKFNDNVFNTNITITIKDSTEINNQSFIQGLPNGLYKIKKNYNDGSTKETVIYKGNN
jgi:hypothetical protein